MKLIKQRIVKALLGSAVLLLLICNSTLAQTGSGSRKAVMEGDTVWVVINHVKPDKRQQFERFVYEIFWPVLRSWIKKRSMLLITPAY